MQQFLIRFCVLLTPLFVAFSLKAQDTTRPTSVDPKLLEWENSTIQQEYKIGKISVSGVKFLDTVIIISISGLQEGQKFEHPNSDVFSKAITNLWNQRLFSDIQIYATAIHGDVVDIEIYLSERPKLGNLKFVGVTKTVAEELQNKIKLVKQNIISEEIRKRIVEFTSQHFVEKGFQNVKVRIEEKPDKNYVNSNALTIYVDKGKKVRIEEINFYGNDNVRSTKLKKQLKNTKEQLKFTLNPSKYKSTYGEKEKPSFKEYVKDWGFLKPTKTLEFLSPYLHVGFGNAKLNNKKFEEDKQKLIAYYNAEGYRDAQIVADTVVNKNGKLYIDMKIQEGNKYYFGKMSWKGITKYPEHLLDSVLDIKRGDVYNLRTLNKRIGKEMSQDGGDISGFYQDDGYLFFRIEAVETAVYNDTIDHEIRVMEGPQAEIKNVTISGNERTKDHVILRELRALPGNLFKRNELIRDQRQLVNLGYFNQETIEPQPVPNPEEGTVDINWKLEEKSSDQLELSAGWGGNIGLTGTVGITFNNFSIKNIWKKESWDPLPTGDGQKLSLRVQSNGRAYRSINFSFTEPWLGGKKPNSLTLAFNNTKFSNAYDPYTGMLNKAMSDTTYLKINSATVSYGKQLKWPDDYFNIVFSLGYTQYKLRNYPGVFSGLGANGTSNNVNLKIGIQRSSIYDNIFPKGGSNIMASVQFTPPYSLFNDKIATSATPFKLVEYHKWRFTSEWYVPIGQPHGSEKSRQFVLKLAAKYGFVGRYNKKMDFSPFERFQVGDAGLNNNNFMLGYDIIAHRGYPVYTSSKPSVNPDLGQTSTTQFVIFNKYQMELRYPLVTNPGSTIYGLTFFEAANGWYNFKEYNPFKLRRSVGVGMRFFLPMFGLLGFDYGLGLDRMAPGVGLKGAGKFTFMLGFEPE